MEMSFFCLLDKLEYILDSFSLSFDSKISLLLAH